MTQLITGLVILFLFTWGMARSTATFYITWKDAFRRAMWIFSMVWAFLVGAWLLLNGLVILVTGE